MSHPSQSVLSRQKDSVLYHALNLVERGKLRRAEKIFVKMLISDPNDIDAHFELGRIYRRLDSMEKAVFHSKKVIRLNSKERNAYLNLGLVYEMEGRPKLAVKYYKKELARHPRSGESLYNLGFLYFERKQWRRAGICLYACFETRFEFRIEHLVESLGFCYFRLYDLYKYVRLYTLYFERVPTAGWAAANLGAALLRAKDFSAAIDRLTDARRLGLSGDVDSMLIEARTRLQANRA